MKIGVLLTIWKRHDLAKIVIKSLLEYKKRYDLEIIVVGSEGKESEKLAKGCHYIESPNLPVSNKHNAGLAKFKELDLDGMILLGSDNFVNENVIKYFFTLSANETNVVGFKDIYFYSTENKELFYFKGYTNSKQTIGAGRFFSKFILEKSNYELWSKGLNRSLDYNCINNLKALQINENMIELSSIDGFIVDIKHTENITQLNDLKFVLQKTENVMAKKLKKEDANAIEKLKAPKEVEAKKEAKATEYPKIEIDENKKYVFVSNGKSRALKAESIQFGFMCNILTKKGLGYAKNIDA
jgi:hypothetical protein